MADQRRFLGRLTTRQGMICPVDGTDRGRMMSVNLSGHGGSGVSTPCRSDHPGGSVTTDRFKVVRKGYIRSAGLVGARLETPRPTDVFGALERDIQFAISWRSGGRLPTTSGISSTEFRNALWFFRANRFVESVFCDFFSSAKFSHTGVAKNRETITIGTT